MVVTLGRTAHHAGKPQGKAFRLHVHTSDPERDLLLQVDDEVNLTDWDGGRAEKELRIPAEAVLRLVYGRLDPEHTPVVEVTAPGINLDDLRGIFPGL